MKSRLKLPLLILVATLAHGQSTKSSDKPDLGKFSSQQLTACYENSQICGTNDEFGYITNELVSRLPEFSTNKLLDCFGNWRICGAADSQATGWPISDEIARRGDPHELLLRFWKEPKWEIRSGIEDVAYHFDTSEVTAFMQMVLVKRLKDGDDFYWPANYLAKKCDQVGLKELNTGRHRSKGSLQYQTTLVLFGKCHYRPAIPYLAGEALYDASLNIEGAAQESLDALYPDHPKEFATLEDVQKYYCGRAKKEGFRINCKSE